MSSSFEPKKISIQTKITESPEMSVEKLID